MARVWSIEAGLRLCGLNRNSLTADYTDYEDRTYGVESS